MLLECWANELLVLISVHNWLWKENYRGWETGQTKGHTDRHQTL